MKCKLGKYIDLAGQKFGKLTVIKRVEDHKDSVERSVIPVELCNHIVDICEEKQISKGDE